MARGPPAGPQRRSSATFLDASRRALASANGRLAAAASALAFASLFAALAAITAVAIVALYQGREAERQRDTAASRELARQCDHLPRRRSRAQPRAGAPRARPRDTEQAENVLRQATLAVAAPAPPGMRTTTGCTPSSRAADGRQVVTAGRDGAVRLWSIGRRAPALRSWTRTRAGGRSARASRPTADRVASTGRRRRRRGLGRGERPQAGPLCGSKLDYATTVDFSPDGRRVIVPVLDGTVRVLGRRRRRPGEGPARHTGPVVGGALQPGRLHARSAPATTGPPASGTSARARPPSCSIPAVVNSADFSPDGRLVATAAATASSGSGTRAAAAAREHPHGRAGGRIRALRRGRQPPRDRRRGRCRASCRCSRGPPLRRCGATVVRCCRPPSSPVRPGGQRRRGPDAPRVDAARLHDHPRPRSPGRASRPDGRRVVSGGEDGAVRVWDTATGSLSSFRSTRDTASPSSPPTASRSISAGYDGTVRISDAGGGPSRVVYNGAGPVFVATLDPSESGSRSPR